MRYWLALIALFGGGVVTLAALLRTPAPPRAAVIRLVDHLAEARRVEQRVDLIDPEVLRLKAGAIATPLGWTSLGGEVAHFVAPSPRPIHLLVEVPIDGGRDYVVRATARDASGNLRMLVQHAPNLEQPEPGWHRATDERAVGGRVRFDWREDTPANEKLLPIVFESAATNELIIESFTVREAGARDPGIVEAAPAAALHGLVDRSIEGASAVSRRGARRLLPSLLASDLGVYEFALPAPPPSELTFESAIVPRGAPDGLAPMELRVELQSDGVWQTAFSETRGGAGDAGFWRAAQLAIPPSARGVRFTTRASGAGRPQVVAWGNPILRDAPHGRRHVVLITLDAVRPDHLGAYGYFRPTSPFLDKLATRGARFTDVTAQRSHTWASTTSLLSGQFPQSNGVLQRGDRPWRGIAGLAQSFAQAGYTTARIGSPDLPRGQLPGFDDTEIADYDTDLMTRLGELGRAYADRPLFLWVHVSTAHYPWNVADEFNRFDPGWQGPFAHAISRADFRALLDAGPIPEPIRNHLTALYDGAILQMDQRLGVTLAGLDDSGFFDDAVIAVSADHGAHFGEHDVWFMHSTPWHADMQVPLILVAPGQIAPGLVVKERVLLVDVAPTLLDLAGVTADGFDGISLRPALGGQPLPERTVVTRFDPASYVTVENSRYRLLWNPQKEPLTWPGELKRALPLPALALYDRETDPNERKDISADHPDIVKALRSAAERDFSEHDSQATHLSTEARRLLREAGYLDDK